MDNASHADTGEVVDNDGGVREPLALPVHCGKGIQVNEQANSQALRSRTPEHRLDALPVECRRVGHLLRVDSKAANSVLCQVTHDFVRGFFIRIHDGNASESFWPLPDGV